MHPLRWLSDLDRELLLAALATLPPGHGGATALLERLQRLVREAIFLWGPEPLPWLRYDLRDLRGLPLKRLNALAAIALLKGFGLHGTV